MLTFSFLENTCAFCAFRLHQTMIRNRCENFGDGLCQESKSIKVLQEYLKAHGLESEVHARPERPERQNLICK